MGTENVPVQVLEQLEAARAEAQEAEPVTPDEPTQDTGTDGDQTPLAGPEPEQASPEPTPSPTEGTEPALPEEPVSTEEDVEAQNKRLKANLDTLQGKFNAEVPRQAAQIKALEEELGEKGEHLAALEKRAVAPVVEPSTAPQTLTDDRLRQYGLTQEQLDSAPLELFEGMTKVIGPIAREVAKQVVQEQLEPVQELSTAQAEDRFLEQLSTRVVGWPDINESQEFRDWLGGYDVMRRRTYQELLDGAHGAYDAPAAAALFETFKREAQTTPTPSVESQVMPRVAANSPPAPKALLTEDKAAEMFDAVVRGDYGPPTGPRALEIRAQIRAAQEKGFAV